MPSDSTTPAPRCAGIYQIRNLLDGKVYIGSSVNIRMRWKEHRKTLRGSKHRNRFLQRAWNKFGAEAFVFEVLLVVDDPADLARVEQEYIDRTECCWRTKGYNLAREAERSPTLGRKLSLETRAKMSKFQKGRKRGPQSQEQRANSSERMKKKWEDPEFRAKSLASLDMSRLLSPEVIAKRAEKLRGRKKPGSSSQYNGVVRHKAGGWTAWARGSGRPSYLGYFDDELDAAYAHDRAAREMFGAAAMTNFESDDPSRGLRPERKNIDRKPAPKIQKPRPPGRRNGNIEASLSNLVF